MTLKLLRFFGCVTFAVFILSVLALTLSVATFFESYLGTAAAHYSIYKTPWFMGILFFIGISVISAAVKQYPWKRYQTGFLITHIGIITLIIGSYITFQWGIDGNLPLRDGESGGEIYLNEEKIDISTSAPKLSIPDFKVVFSRFLNVGPYLQEKKLFSFNLSKDIEIYVDRFLPYAREMVHYEASENLDAIPALKIKLHNAFVNIDPWLSAATSSGEEMNLGPASISFRKIGTQEILNDFLSDAPNEFLGEIVVIQNDETYTIPLFSKDLKQPKIPIQHTPFTLKQIQYYSDAVVEKMRLKNRSDADHNPAVELTLVGSKGEERHVAFAHFPDFPSTHQKRSLYGVKIQFVAKESINQKKLELATFNGRVYYRIPSGKNGRKGEAEVGKSYDTGWMNLKFEVDTFYSKAIKKIEYNPVAVKDPNNPKVPKVIRFGFQKKGEPQIHYEWLELFSTKMVKFEGNIYQLRFQPKTYELPFTLHLNQFQMGTDPGTDDPASYKSDVEIRDGDAFQTIISMNEPLTHKNFTFYQASYQTDEQGKPVGSIFSVGYDPGRWVKYTGSILIVLGIIVMFFYRKAYVELIQDYFRRKRA